MEIVPIFVLDDQKKEGLYNMVFDEDCDLEELDRLMDLWINPRYLYDQFNDNKVLIKSGAFENITGGENFFETIYDAASSIDAEFRSLARKAPEISIPKLKSLFKPLDQSQVPDDKDGDLDDSSELPRVLLFAVRCGENSFVISGGAIRYTDSLLDHEDTVKELIKMEKTENFLRQEGFTISQQKFYYYGKH